MMQWYADYIGELGKGEGGGKRGVWEDSIGTSEYLEVWVSMVT